MGLILAPSILAADFSALGREIETVAGAGAGYIHFDVMDGHFVKNLSFGVPVLESLRPLTKLTLDVHLMVYDPLPLAEMFVSAGADIITIHLEAAGGDIHPCLRRIREMGKKASVAIKPATPAEAALPLLEDIDMVLVMSVEPGFGGQPLKPEALRKAEALAEYIRRNALCTDIEMDGGINQKNIREVLNAGVNVVVAGTSVFAKNAAQTAANTRAFLRAFEEWERI
jgi:ribulose-phosphate 3-epimerase